MIHSSTDDRGLVELILQLIDHLDRRLRTRTWPDFLADVDEIDLTAYRLLHIGEAGNRLSNSLRERHSEIDWRAMYRMRNILSHDYATVDPMTIWETARGELAALRLACATELDRLDE